MKKAIAILLALVLCFSLFACVDTSTTDGDETAAAAPADTAASASDGTQTDETAEPALDADQYFNTYLSNEPTTLDISLRSDSYSSTIMINTMEGLVRNGEKDGEYVTTPGVAESWEANEDGTVWTFHLRDSYWSDGEPVTAQQFVYSLQRSAAPETGSPSSFFLQPLKNFTAVNTGEMALDQLGVKALDDNTLEITLEQPTPAFLQMIDGTVYYPQREDYITQYGDKYGTEAEAYICNGPFKVESWTHNSSIILVKNDTYWDADSVNLSRITLSIMPDENTSYNAFQSGELDYVTTESMEWLETFKATDAEYVSSASASLTYAFFNSKDALFQNANIRKAFTLALDREDVNDMVFSGLRVPTYGWVVPAISVGETNYRQAAGDMIQEMIDELAAEGKTPKDLLVEGMEELGLGSDPSTLQVTFSLAGTSEWFRTLGEYLQQVYKEELGVNMEISYSEWGIFYDNVLNGNYQIGFMSWGAYYNDPYDVLSLFVSSYDAIATGWSNAQYDELIAAASGEMDEATRLQEYIDAETILIKDECVACPLATWQSHAFYRSYVHGYSTLGFSNDGFKYMYTSGR
ncbi:MAG TPA: peptide ABC transporter substrate-binding protein [Eubacteriales bacterium]|nr:peptide ABC transporter substrate-binding protein [Eubacteriales bacterium]